MSSHVPTTLLPDGNIMIEDTIPTLKKFKLQQGKQANKQMIPVWWDLLISLPEFLAVPSQSALGASFGGS